MSQPPLSEAEAQTHTTFTALMWALSYPGRLQPLPATGLRAFLAIGEALVDLETSYYTPHAELAGLIARTGARRRSPAEARYQFFPELQPADLDHLLEAPVGSYAYPDEAATIVVGCVVGAGTRLRLSGPGIAGTTTLLVGGLPAAFWSLRQAMIRYPLGWDLFLVGGDRVVGLPRTTLVEVV